MMVNLDEHKLKLAKLPFLSSLSQSSVYEKISTLLVQLLLVLCTEIHIVTWNWGPKHKPRHISLQQQWPLHWNPWLVPWIDLDMEGCSWWDWVWEMVKFEPWRREWEVGEIERQVWGIEREKVERGRAHSRRYITHQGTRGLSGWLCWDDWWTVDMGYAYLIIHCLPCFL
jgi:hypothetical protein